MDKSDSAYKTIGEVAKILELKANKKGILPTHIIRFWETQFKQIKPKILNFKADNILVLNVNWLNEKQLFWTWTGNYRYT